MARILVAANSTWNLKNFRLGLIQELVRAGHEVITLSPDPQGIVVGDKDLLHVPWRMERSRIGPFTNLTAMLRVIKIIRQENPDIFLGFTIKPNIYGAIACRRLKVPALLNVSGLGTAFLSGSALRRAVLLLYQFAFAKADAVFFQNPDDAELLIKERAVRTNQVHLLPGSGVDLTNFTRSSLPAEPRFLMVARLLAHKGVREYVAAARQLKARIPKATFALLGQLDQQNRSAITKDELSLWAKEGIVDYRGATDDVRPFMRQASAIVLPSYREGLPRALLEGAAMGRVLIATDVPGCRQLVKEGVTGYLCEARSAKSLAAAMERFANSAYRERLAMADNARTMAVEEFDERLVVEAYLREIDKCVGNAG
jgi:glycosyltransferase involved in cell wall biosynthesis